MTNYQLPELDYAYSALDPIITKEMLEIHHDKHHRAYVTNLNKTLEKYHEAEKANDTEKMMELLEAIKFNAGGHINHSIFWKILSPMGKDRLKQNSEIYKAIKKDFGSFENFHDILNESSIGIKGSGWGWLGFNKQMKKLEVQICQNHELLSDRGIFPMFCIDVWEHAYYLKYKNDRATFVGEMWKLLNWKEIDNRYKKVISQS